MTTDEVPMVRTYPEMNAKIVGILRLMPDEAPMTNLYAAQRIEELEAALARSEQRLRAAGEAEDTIRRYALEIEERGRIMNEQSVRAGEAEARAEAMAKMLAAGCEMVLDGRLDRFWAMGADAMARRVVEFTPPRAGEEEPPATQDRQSQLVRELQGALWRIRDAVMHEGGWYETAEGARIAEAVNAIWRDARDRGLSPFNPNPVADAALTAAPPARRVDVLEMARDALESGIAFFEDQFPGADPYRVFILNPMKEAFAALAPASGAGPGDGAEAGDGQ